MTRLSWMCAIPLLACGDDSSPQTGGDGSTSSSSSSSSVTSSSATAEGSSSSTLEGSSSSTTAESTAEPSETTTTTGGSGPETDSSESASTGAPLETGDIAWERSIDIEDMDEAVDIAWAATGDVYVTGRSNTNRVAIGSNLIVRSLDADDGSDQWSDVHTSIGDAGGLSVDVSASGVLVGGYTSAASGVTHELIRVYDDDGSSSWSYTGATDYVMGLSAAFLPGGDVLLVSGAGNGNYLTRRVASSGTVTWTDTRSTQHVTDVAVATDGIVYIVGAEGEDGWIASLSPDAGAENWSATWSGSGSTWFNTIAIGPTGDLFTVGSVLHDDYDWDVGVQRWSAEEGNVVWAAEHDLAGNSFEDVRGIAVSASGRTVVCGWHDPDADLWTATSWAGELDDTGDLVWQRSYDARICDSIAIDDEDYAYVAGSSGPATDYDVWVAKIAP